MNLIVDYSETSSRNFYVDCVAISVIGVIMIGMVILGVYLWFRRCRGPDCEVCYRYHQMSFEQRLLMDDDIFQDIPASNDTERGNQKRD